MEPVGKAATADAPPSATPIVEVATSSSIIHNRRIQGSNSAHSTINNSRPHDSSSSGDTCSRRSGNIRSISNTIPGPAGWNHLSNSSPGAERLTSETTTSGRRSVVLAPATHVPTPRRRGALPYRLQGNSEHARISDAALSVFDIISRSSCRAVRLSPVPLLHGHRMNTAMDTRPRPVTGLHCPQSAMHLRRRYHHRPDPTDHLHRRLPRNTTGALHPGIPGPLRDILCSRQFWGSFVSSDWSLRIGSSVGGCYFPSAFVGKPVGIE